MPRLSEDGIRGSELVIFEESGHQLYIEEQDKFLSIVRGFMRKAFVTSPRIAKG